MTYEDAIIYFKRKRDEQIGIKREASEAAIKALEEAYRFAHLNKVAESDQEVLYEVMAICNACPSLTACAMCKYDRVRIALEQKIERDKSIDAEPVVHGHWEFCAESVDTMWDCKCSVCGSVEQPLQRHHYCPNCGAKMDEEE